MIFTTISKNNLMFGKGKELDKDYFEIREELKMFFLWFWINRKEFGEYGLIEYSEIDEPS